MNKNTDACTLVTHDSVDFCNGGEETIPNAGCPVDVVQATKDASSRCSAAGLTDDDSRHKEPNPLSLEGELGVIDN